MICPNCQKEVPATAKACGYCGHWLVSSDQKVPAVEKAKDESTIQAGKSDKNNLLKEPMSFFGATPDDQNIKRPYGLAFRKLELD